MTDLLAARTLRGTALAARPHIALVDELTGQLLALTDATGLRAGRALGPPPPTDAYRPTDPLNRYVQTRDRRCRFPGCRRQPLACDAHHLQHWADGGHTSLDNLVLLCRAHHTLLHATPWQVRLSPLDRKPELHPPPGRRRATQDWIRAPRPRE